MIICKFNFDIKFYCFLCMITREGTTFTMNTAILHSMMLWVHHQKNWYLFYSCLYVCTIGHFIRKGFGLVLVLSLINLLAGHWPMNWPKLTLTVALMLTVTSTLTVTLTLTITLTVTSTLTVTLTLTIALTLSFTLTVTLHVTLTVTPLPWIYPVVHFLFCRY